MRNNLKFILVLIATLGFAQFTLAAEDGSRGEKKMGFYGSVLSDPYPNLWGINFGYNVTSFLRGVAGYGGFSYTEPVSNVSVTGTAIGFGATAFVPGWNFSPYAGLHYSIFSAQGTFQFQGTSFSQSDSRSILYMNLGLEWQTGYGLLFGLGYAIPLNTEFATAGVNVPCLRLGWFF